MLTIGYCLKQFIGRGDPDARAQGICLMDRVTWRSDHNRVSGFLCGLCGKWLTRAGTMVFGVVTM
jgi:hypothetical protein